MKASACATILILKDPVNNKVKGFCFGNFLLSCFIMLFMLLMIPASNTYSQAMDPIGKNPGNSYESFKPVTIDKVTSAHGAFASRVISIITSATPATGENIFVRYSMNNYRTSEIVLATGSGMNWTATIPWQRSAVSYYVYTSKRKLEDINTDVVSRGQSAHSRAILSTANNAGGNYSWTPLTGNVIISGSGHADITTASLNEAFDLSSLFNGDVTILITANTTEIPDGSTTLLQNSVGVTSISIRPSGHVSAVGLEVDGIINIAYADNILIDGLNDGANSLTISNLSTSNSSLVKTIDIGVLTTDCTITNCTILGSAKSSFTGTIDITGDKIDRIYITNNSIGPAGNNFPAMGINIGPYRFFNGINIQGNKIYDYFSDTEPSAGVYTRCKGPVFIQSNKFYQTAARTQSGTGSIHAPIWINNDSAVCQVNYNTIGFSSSSGTGMYGFTGIFTSEFYPIFIENAYNLTGNLLQGNIVSNLAVSGSMKDSSFNCIYVKNCRADIINSNIGSQSATGSISYSSSAGSANVCSAIRTSNITSQITDNTIGGISITGTNSSFTAININGNLNSSCSNNTIGGTVTNSIQSTGSGAGIYLKGIYVGAVSNPVNDNIIRNFRATNSASITAIELTGFTGDNTIAQNTIFNLSNTSSSASPVITGIIFNGGQSFGGTANFVRRNNIYGLTVSSNSSSAKIIGIEARSGNTSYRNNMIALGAGIGDAVSITGILESASTDDVNFWHNSIYIGGTPGAGPASANSYAFRNLVTTNTRYINNNIFVNARSNSGALGRNYAIELAGTTVNPPGLNMNYNVYYVNGSGTILGRFNGVNRSDLSSWRSATGLDQGSFQDDPQYKDPTNATPDLHIHATNETVVEGAGSDMGVTNDFDGQDRSTRTPTDIGADAGNFTAVPGMTYSSSTAVQQTGLVCAGATNVPVLGMEVVTTGKAFPLRLSSLTINGSDASYLPNVASYRIYYTGDRPLFDTTYPIIPTTTGLTLADIIVIPTGTITLVEGKNYFWLAYNIASSISAPFVDGRFKNVTLSTGGGTPIITNPGGVITMNTSPDPLNTTAANICLNGSGSLLASSTTSCYSLVNSGTSFSGTWNGSGDPIAKRPTNNISNSSTCSFDGLGVTSNYAATSFQVSVTGSYTFAMSNDPGFDGMAYLVSGAFIPGNCSGGGTWIKGDDDSGSGDEPQLTANLAAGVMYTMISTVYLALPYYSGHFNWTVTPPAGGEVLLPTQGNIEWYTAPIGGTAIATGSTFNPVGVNNSGLDNTATAGTTVFYVACSNTGTCRTPVNFTIHHPTVDFTGLPTSYCINQPVLTLTGSPLGGNFSGTGITGNSFNPATAGVGGPYTILYTYSDAFGCTNSKSRTIIVNGLTALNFSGLAASYCTSAPVVTLTGSPSGGSFSGPGISGNIFNPGIPGVGTHNIVYTYTNSFGCTNSISKSVVLNACEVTVNLKLYLQGYYIGANSMQSVLEHQSVPLSTLSQTDTVIIELHHPATFALINSKKAILLINGTVSATFTNPPGDYFIAIRHRNSIQTWTAAPVACLPSTSLYNFTTAANKAYANNQVLVAPNVWAFYTGDINQDEYIDGNDFPLYDGESASGGLFDATYTLTDLNGDGFVDGNDFPVFDNNSSNGVSSIHP